MEEGKKSLITEIENILKNQSKDLKQDEGLKNIFCLFFLFCFSQFYIQFTVLYDSNKYDIFKKLTRVNSEGNNFSSLHLQNRV